MIVRVDLFQLRDGQVPESPYHFVTVKEVIESEEAAAAEVERLNQANADKDVVYFYSEGRVLA